MAYTREELGVMTLQRLAYVLPQDMEQENLVKEIFEQRAAVSSYKTLTSIDVKLGWQEAILQKYVDEKREAMAQENAAVLAPEDEAMLDTNVITKEKELELQAKLDAKNKKKKKNDDVVEELPVAESPTPKPEKAVVDPVEEQPAAVVEPKKGKKGSK